VFLYIHRWWSFSDAGASFESDLNLPFPNQLILMQHGGGLHENQMAGAYACTACSSHQACPVKRYVPQIQT